LNASRSNANGWARSICAPRKSRPNSPERLETIITEREDIIDAIKKLRAGIQSLNKEGRERLLVALMRSTPSSSGCSPTCLAAVRRNCS
jgi:hypothetical protein